MVTVDEHSFEETLLPKKPKVLDAGCRGFGFADYFHKHYPEATYIAVDADPNVKPPNYFQTDRGLSQSGIIISFKNDSKFFYLNNVISNSKASFEKIYCFDNGLSNFTQSVGDKPQDCKEYFIPVLNITSFYDLVKLDIEGSEGSLLMEMKRPFATQISVEFHMHTCQWMDDNYINTLFNQVSQWYNIYNKVCEKRHGCPRNFWDVVMILKNL